MTCADDGALLAGYNTVKDRCARQMLNVVVDESHWFIGHGNSWSVHSLVTRDQQRVGARPNDMFPPEKSQFTMKLHSSEHSKTIMVKQQTLTTCTTPHTDSPAHDGNLVKLDPALRLPDFNGF